MMVDFERELGEMKTLLKSTNPTQVARAKARIPVIVESVNVLRRAAGKPDLFVEALYGGYEKEELQRYADMERFAANAKRN